jgi:hypothetical protein
MCEKTAKDSALCPVCTIYLLSDFKQKPFLMNECVLAEAIFAIVILMDKYLDTFDLCLKLAMKSSHTMQPSSCSKPHTLRNWPTLSSNAEARKPHAFPTNAAPPKMDRNLRQSKPRLLLMGQRRLTIPCMMKPEMMLNYISGAESHPSQALSFTRCHHKKPCSWNLLHAYRRTRCSE